jgi:hypothetical protein
MKHRSILFSVREHCGALLAALAAAHAIGLVEMSALVPRAMLAGAMPTGQLIGTAVCAMVYVIVLAWLHRRRLVPGPLYRCGETRPPEAYGKAYIPGTTRLLEGWQYR